MMLGSGRSITRVIRNKHREDNIMVAVFHVRGQKPLREGRALGRSRAEATLVCLRRAHLTNPSSAEGRRPPPPQLGARHPGFSAS